MMCRVVSGISLGNHVDAYPGDVVDIPDRMAAEFIRRGKVVAADDQAEADTGDQGDAETPRTRRRRA